MKELDHYDMQILELLQEDARITNKELSAKLGLSTTPIFERVKKLERNGYIKKYVALVDQKKLDKNLTSILSVSLSKHTNEAIQNFLKNVAKFDQVMECYHIAGQSDFVLKVIVEDMDAYQDFIVNHFSKMENLSRLQSSFVMKEMKHTTAFKFDELKE